MGYKINRVPLDFSWPLNKVWCGYVNPHLSHLKECSCDNGYSQYGTHLNNLWYGYSEFKPEDNGSVPFSPEDECIVAFATRNVTRAPEYYGTATQENIHEECVRLANLFNGQWACHLNQDDVNALIEADRLYTFTHRPINPITEDDIKNHAYYLWLNAGCPENSDVYFWELSKEQHSRHYLPYNNGYIPTATEVNRWNIMSMGHDSINASVVILARAKREGKSAICEICQGAGSFWTSTEHENLYNNWEKEDPPIGDGYQCWETVGSGSPISPVFSTPEALAEYLSKNYEKQGTYEEWLKFINSNQESISLVEFKGNLLTGVQFIARTA